MRSIGIHLGLLHTTAAVAKAGTVEAVHDAAGATAIPSVVALDGQRWLVGEAALRHAKSHQRLAVAGFKQMLGCRREELALPSDLPFEILGESSELAIRHGHRETSVVELTGKLLGPSGNTQSTKCRHLSSARWLQCRHTFTMDNGSR